jgi:hypothetical protein
LTVTQNGGWRIQADKAEGSARVQALLSLGGEGREMTRAKKRKDGGGFKYCGFPIPKRWRKAKVILGSNRPLKPRVRDMLSQPCRLTAVMRIYGTVTTG